MEGLIILGVNTLCRLFCFFKLFPSVGLVSGCEDTLFHHKPSALDHLARLPLLADGQVVLYADDLVV